MAIVSRQEFADMCGDDVKLLNVYINRKKVIMHDVAGKQIDTENMINMLYKKKRKEINNSKKEDANIIKSIVQNPRKNKKSDEDEPDENEIPPPLELEFISEILKGKNTSISPDGSMAENMQGWIQKKMKGDAELVTVKVEKEKMLLAKAAGELLPVGVAMNAHRIYMKSIVTSFETGIMNIANRFCHIMAAGNMDMYTKITEECRKELARCVADAGGECNRELELMIKEFTSTRRPGERK